jgi:tRNA(adenine34) deaminase
VAVAESVRGGTGEDERWMRHAMALARQAEALGEVPVGAVIVRNGMLVAEGFNQPIATNDPTQHAEMVAIRSAAAALGTYRLTGVTLYVTLEPCPMCAGAMVHARVARLVYAAHDPRAGAAGSVFDIVDHASLNHRIDTTAGVLGDACSHLLRDFFVRRR